MKKDWYYNKLKIYKILIIFIKIYDAICIVLNDIYSKINKIFKYYI